MARFICVQCGTQYPDSAAPPARCIVCDEPRQYVRWDGQAWTTLEELRSTHRLRFADEAENITGIGMEPPFAITQRALLLQSPAGNILWDCVSLVNDEVVAEIGKRGGVAGIAISHPHYYTTMLEWSEALGGVPIHIHADDREWVLRSGPAINHWTGDTLKLNDEMTLIRCGGHFPGSTVLHWGAAMGGKGALFAGDTVQVVTDRKHVSFMYSYPNFIPLSAREVRRIADPLAPYEFDSIFGIYWNLKIVGNGKRQFEISVERYLRAIAG
jgi:glyoxylase-like metal-dependent hydrolase (beta-lactamase superfamily II)